MTNTTFSHYKVKGQGEGHCRGKNHTFGNNFACNEDKNMKPTPICLSMKCPSNRHCCYDVTFVAKTSK